MGRSFPHHTGPPSCSRWPSLDQASVMSGRLGAPGYASLGAGSTGMTTASAAFRPRTELGHSWNLMPAQRGIEKSSSSLREADCSTAIEPPHDMSTTEPSAMFAVCRMPGLNRRQQTSVNYSRVRASYGTEPVRCQSCDRRRPAAVRLHGPHQAPRAHGLWHGAGGLSEPADPSLAASTPPWCYDTYRRRPRGTASAGCTYRDPTYMT